MFSFLGVGLYLLYLTFHKHFPPNHRLHKICNRNVIKLSYSYTPNMASFISAHNRKLLNKDDNSAKKPCNCRDKANCPMPEGCRDRGVVYEARVECNGNTRIYNGLCETELKHAFATTFNHLKIVQRARLPNSQNLFGIARTLIRQFHGKQFIMPIPTNTAADTATFALLKSSSFSQPTLILL